MNFINNPGDSVVITLVVISKFGCGLDQISHTFRTIDIVTPSFTQNKTDGCGPLIVQFSNTSSQINGIAFNWDFGNGITSTSVNPNPVTFIASSNGKDSTYVITLSATNACKTFTYVSKVLVKGIPKSVFSPSATVGCAPFNVTFTNSSPTVSALYTYDFGDGTSKTVSNRDPVTHIYQATTVRNYIVTLTAQNECGTDVSQYTIKATPHAIVPELVVDSPEKAACGPLTVHFRNNSQNASSFIYDFGDGSPTQTTNTSPETVIHTFIRAGNYLVKLKAINGCSDTTTTELITVYGQPKAVFSANVVKGCNGLAVTFKNSSQNALNYVWDFGDGGTSTLANPTHTFNDSKTFYTVRLIATNILGCRDTSLMQDYINIFPIHAKFDVLPGAEIAIPDYTFKFSDQSTNSPVTWQWKFGDGSSSNLQNPEHTYPDTGRFRVKLLIRNQDGCPDSIFRIVRITGVPGYLFLPNSFMPGSATPELRIFRVKGSGISEWTMQIFNKWGELIWRTDKLVDNSPVEFWDGTINGNPAPQGVYFWTISLTMISKTEWKGMTYDNSPPKRTGVIHLLR